MASRGKQPAERVPEGSTRLSTVVDAALYRQVKVTAILSGRSVQDVVGEALSEWVARNSA